jgi:hypothetical protein
MQGPSHESEHVPVKAPGLDPCGDLSLKFRDQAGGVGVAAVGAVAQMLKQPLQEKQIAEGKHLVLAGWRHVASGTFERDENLVRGTFEVEIEIGHAHRRLALGKRGSDPSRMLIRRRGFWLGSAHRECVLKLLDVTCEPIIAPVKFNEIHRRFQNPGTR